MHFRGLWGQYCRRRQGGRQEASRGGPDGNLGAYHVLGRRVFDGSRGRGTSWPLTRPWPEITKENKVSEVGDFDYCRRTRPRTGMTRTGAIPTLLVPCRLVGSAQPGSRMIVRRDEWRRQGWRADGRRGAGYPPQEAGGSVTIQRLAATRAGVPAWYPADARLRGTNAGLPSGYRVDAAYRPGNGSMPPTDRTPAPCPLTARTAGRCLVTRRRPGRCPRTDRTPSMPLPRGQRADDGYAETVIR